MTIAIGAKVSFKVLQSDNSVEYMTGTVVAHVNDKLLIKTAWGHEFTRKPASCSTILVNSHGQVI